MFATVLYVCATVLYVCYGAIMLVHDTLWNIDNIVNSAPTTGKNKIYLIRSRESDTAENRPSLLPNMRILKLSSLYIAENTSPRFTQGP